MNKTVLKAFIHLWEDKQESDIVKCCDKGQLRIYSLRKIFKEDIVPIKKKYHVYFLEMQRYKAMPTTATISFPFLFFNTP